MTHLWHNRFFVLLLFSLIITRFSSHRIYFFFIVVVNQPSLPVADLKQLTTLLYTPTTYSSLNSTYTPTVSTAIRLTGHWKKRIVPMSPVRFYSPWFILWLIILSVIPPAMNLSTSNFQEFSYFLNGLYPVFAILCGCGLILFVV